MRGLRGRIDGNDVPSVGSAAFHLGVPCLRPVTEPVAYALRNVAFAYGGSLGSNHNTPRSVLFRSLQQSRRAAQAKKCMRMAERFAEPVGVSSRWCVSFASAVPTLAKN
jgi:hypothetical protein